MVPSLRLAFFAVLGTALPCACASLTAQPSKAAFAAAAPVPAPLFATRYTACRRIPDDVRGTFAGAGAVVVLTSHHSVLEAAEVRAAGCEIGVYVAPNAPSARINRVQISGGTFGIVVDGARNVSISNAQLDGGRRTATGGIGILFQPNADGSVNRANVTHTGIGIELSEARATVSDSTLEDTTDGLIAEKSSILTLSRTVAARALDFGFYCSDSHLRSIERNVARDNGLYGFYFARCTGVASAVELAQHNEASSGNPSGDFEVSP